MDYHNQYEVVRGSDIVRDGMFLELRDGVSKQLILEAFYSDVDGSLSLEHFCAGVPAEVVKWFRQQAAERLPPGPAGEGPATVGGSPGPPVL